MQTQSDYLAALAAINAQHRMRIARLHRRLQFAVIAGFVVTLLAACILNSLAA